MFVLPLLLKGSLNFSNVGPRLQMFCLSVKLCFALLIILLMCESEIGACNHQKYVSGPCASNTKFKVNQSVTK